MSEIDTATLVLFGPYLLLCAAGVAVFMAEAVANTYRRSNRRATVHQLPARREPRAAPQIKEAA